MSVFTKNKNNWIIAVLVLLNLLTLGLYWFGDNLSGPPHRDEGAVVRFFQSELGLSEDQTANVQELITNHRKRVVENFDDLHQKRKKIVDALTLETPDTATAFQLAREVGGHEEQMQIFLIEHYSKIWATCDESQQQKLRKIFKETIRGPRHGKGRKGGPPPPPRRRE